MTADCVQNFRITFRNDLTSIAIMPGDTNCFSCDLADTISNVTRQVSDSGGHLVSVLSSQHAEAVSDTLLIAMPETYVQPGVSGQRTIVCSTLYRGNQLHLTARLGYPGMT